MEIRQLKHFLAVLDHGSMSKAAAALGLSHQGLSKSLAGLENELKAKLLVRGPRGVSASAYGEVLAEYARFIDGEHDNAVQALAALRGSGAGHLTVAAGISASSGALPIAAARLLERRPGTTLSVLTGPYAEFRNALRDGEVALFVGTVSDEPPAPPVVRETLFTDHDFIVARRGHPLVARRTVALEDLQKYPWIFSVGTLEFRRNFIRMFEERRLEVPRSMIESDSLDVTKASLLRTDFLTLLPRQAIAAEERAGLLALVPFDSPAWSREVAVVYRRRGVRFGLLETLLEELRRAAADLRTSGA